MRLCGAVILLFAAVSFGWLYPMMQPRFAGQVAQAAPTAHGSRSRSSSSSASPSTTAAPCSSISRPTGASTAKCSKQTVLHTEPVEQAIAASGAVTMYADYTRYPPEIKDTIHALRSNGVPVIAVFPGDRPYEPIVFRGGYTQDGLIEALEKATGRRLRTDSGAMADVGVTPRDEQSTRRRRRLSENRGLDLLSYSSVAIDIPSKMLLQFLQQPQLDLFHVTQLPLQVGNTLVESFRVRRCSEI